MVPATVVAAAPAAAAGAPTQNLQSGCVQTFDPNVDYFPEKVSLEEVKDASLRYERNYKVLTVRADLIAPSLRPQVVVMVQCGPPTPPLVGELAGARVVQVPVKTFGLTRNDDLASAVALGVSDGLVTHGFPTVYPADIDQRLRSGQIAANGGGIRPQEMNFEAVLAKRPEVMFVGMNAAAGSIDAMDRLQTLGIPSVPTMTSVGTTVLGRAEWAKIIALPFNREAEANRLLGNVLRDYRDLSARARAQANKPTAIFAQCGTNGECTVSRNGWQSQLMEDAGLRNLIADPSRPPALDPASIEQVFEWGANADWFLAFSFPGPKYTGPLMPRFRAFQTRQIISNDHPGVSQRDGNLEYFFTGALRPDLLLKDIVAPVYPALVPNHTVKYMGISPFHGQ